MNIPCGGFYIDDATLKFKQDGKTLYVASDIQGNLTDEMVQDTYAPKHNAEFTGTTQADSLVVVEDIDCGTLSASSRIVVNGVDLLHEIQSLETRIRELENSK